MKWLLYNDGMYNAQWKSIHADYLSHKGHKSTFQDRSKNKREKNVYTIELAYWIEDWGCIPINGRTNGMGVTRNYSSFTLKENNSRHCN